MDLGDLDDFNLGRAVLLGLAGIAAIILMLMIMGRVIELRTYRGYKQDSVEIAAEKEVDFEYEPEQEKGVTAGAGPAQNSVPGFRNDTRRGIYLPDYSY